MEINTVVITYNNREVLRRSIEALLVQEFSHDQYEIIVAETLQQSALAFGLKRVVHPYTAFFYVQAPGS
jgi:glycosyltransferase involved in cell wall biosynthesis